MLPPRRSHWGFSLTPGAAKTVQLHRNLSQMPCSMMIDPGYAYMCLLSGQSLECMLQTLHLSFIHWFNPYPLVCSTLPVCTALSIHPYVYISHVLINIYSKLHASQRNDSARCYDSIMCIDAVGRYYPLVCCHNVGVCIQQDLCHFDGTCTM